MAQLKQVNESNFMRCNYYRNTHVNGVYREELTNAHLPEVDKTGDATFIMHMLENDKPMTFKELLAEVVMYYYQNFNGELYDAFTTLSLVKKIVRGINDALKLDIIRAELP